MKLQNGGKRYAAKVSKIVPGDTELPVRQKVEKIRSQLPPEVSKHIIRCYNIFPNIHEEETGHDINIYVMEIMRPMTNVEEKILYQGINEITPNKEINKKYDIEKIYNNLKLMLKHELSQTSLFREIEHFQEYLLEALKMTIQKAFNITNINEPNYYIIFTQKLTKMMMQYLIKNMIIKSAYDPLYERCKSALLVNIEDTLLKFREEDDNLEFPMSGRWQATPEKVATGFEKQREFYQALQYLSKIHNITWIDLHGNNVMIRPTTRDYVAVDIGFFKLN